MTNGLKHDKELKRVIRVTCNALLKHGNDEALLVVFRRRGKRSFTMSNADRFFIIPWTPEMKNASACKA